MRLKAFSLALICVFAAPIAGAQNLGVYGKTYPIQEKDGVAQLKKAVKDKLANGGKEAMQKGAQERFTASLNAIKTPDGITRATTNSSKLVDLSATVDKDIKTPEGQLIAPKGMRINPLEIKPLTKKLFFIDASDKRQMDLVKARASDEDKIILLGGSFFGAQDYLQRRLYLDVTGLHTQMKITRLPSIAYQSGVLLKVDEVAQ